VFTMQKPISSKISRGSAELAILSLLEKQVLYGFEICKRIEEGSGGALYFTLASLYPMLYELEKRGWIEGKWQANQAGRDRRYYRLRPEGKRQLAPLRKQWHAFFMALDQLAGVNHA
jgi:PadR family transcriptional regulator, regulatory protein PadR